MKLADLGPYYQEQLTHVAELAAGQSLWRETARGLIARTAHDASNTDDLLQMVHETQRLSGIRRAGLENDAAFRAAIDAENPPTWNLFTPPPVDMALQVSLAQKLYNIEAGKNDFGLIAIGNAGCEVGKWLVEKCQAEKAPFIVQIADPVFQTLLLNHASDDAIKTMAAQTVRNMAPVTKHMIAGSGTPDKIIEPDHDKKNLYAAETKPFHLRRMSGEIFYTLTRIPTPKDAEIDQIPYEDYIKLFFEACDQPWDEIGQAQAELIKEFNAASRVRITNDDGTDISMDLIDEDGSHFTFCNSLIGKNVPGSEIFSGMRLNSVNGIIVAKGRFSQGGSPIMENLTLEYKDGELVRFDAEKGLETLRKILSKDKGALRLGELGIGTNPHLTRHVVNGLLVEKICGSFHVAHGDAYKYTEYMGTPVKVDNGNKSTLHWDITTMLRGKGGCIYLDGRKVMDNGQWVDSTKYDVLNRGWEAIPRERRPEHWKNYYDKPAAA